MEIRKDRSVQTRSLQQQLDHHIPEGTGDHRKGQTTINVQNRWIKYWKGICKETMGAKTKRENQRVSCGQWVYLNGQETPDESAPKPQNGNTEKGTLENGEICVRILRTLSMKNERNQLKRSTDRLREEEEAIAERALSFIQYTLFTVVGHDIYKVTVPSHSS